MDGVTGGHDVTGLVSRGPPLVLGRWDRNPGGRLDIRFTDFVGASPTRVVTGGGTKGTCRSQSQPSRYRKRVGEGGAKGTKGRNVLRAPKWSDLPTSPTLFPGVHRGPPTTGKWTSRDGPKRGRDSGEKGSTSGERTVMGVCGKKVVSLVTRKGFGNDSMVDVWSRQDPRPLSRYVSDSGTESAVYFSFVSPTMVPGPGLGSLPGARRRVRREWKFSGG